MTDLLIHPIDPAELDRVRASAHDDHGRPVEYFPSEGGDQLRCCLRLSEVGEPLLVMGHAPLTAERPWREVGPVFVHAATCAGRAPTAGVPDFLATAPRVLRGYTVDGAMHYEGNRSTEAGDDLGLLLDEVLAIPSVAEVHVRNLLAQCFITRVTAGR